jgi:HlyD family secretion protein
VLRYRIVCALCAVLVAACNPAPPALVYQGYVEADLVDISAPLAGKVETLAVVRGQQVEAGAALFRLEDTPERAAAAAANARLEAAQARLDNLLASRRDPELQALRAQASSARAASQLSNLQLQQAERLRASGFVSQARLDEASAQHAGDRARLAEAEAQILNASVAIGRAGEVRAAQAEIQAARAEVEQGEWQLGQKSAAAPVSARVYETYYSAAEWVAAGTPIVSLLPPGHVKLRFFVPEERVSAMAPGTRVQAHCNGCAAPIGATVSYVSPRPEYTPPIIYSRETRAKLVFLVEARPDATAAAGLHPGQPIDVHTTGTTPAASPQ